MSSWQAVIDQAGKSLGLLSIKGNLAIYGEVDGYPAQIEYSRDKLDGDIFTVERIVEVVRYFDVSKDEAVRQALGNLSALSDGKGKTRLEVKDGVVIHRRCKPFVGGDLARSVVADVKGIVGVLKEQIPVKAGSCRLCGGVIGAKALLVEGIVDRLCTACILNMKSEAREAERVFEQIPLNLPLALGAASALGLVGAVAWAGIAVATERMFWLLAIGIGYLVAWGTVKAAGRGGVPVQTVIAVSTVLSVLLGQLFFIGYLVHQQAGRQGGQVNWLAFASGSPQLLIDSGSDTLFALAGGLFGAFSAAKVASKPKFQPEIKS